MVVVNLETVLIGSQAIQYMQGPKHEGQLLALENGEGSSLCPVESKINFVVPSDKILRDFKPVIQIPTKLEPGIFYIMIALLVKYRRPNSTQVQHWYSYNNMQRTTFSSGQKRIESGKEQEKRREIWRFSIYYWCH